MVPKIAGKNAQAQDHIGFLNGDITQPRSDRVGLNSEGTSSFGVAMLQMKSMIDMENMAMMTEKSLINCRTCTI